MKPMGGTEILYNSLLKRINPNDYNINLIKSACSFDLLEENKTNIVWQHLSYDQPAIEGIKDINYTNSVDAFVYVSHWQYMQFLNIYHATFQKGNVIKNAIEPIEYKEKSKNTKLKLIYTSTPWRGLDVLLHSWKLLDRDDIELHVYSSTKIYGSDFHNSEEAKVFKPFLKEVENTKGIVYHGYANNNQVRKALQDAHIFVYPSTFEETSCLAMIEAGAAGCSLLSTNLGALPETSLGYANLLPISKTKDDLSISFTKALNYEIDEFWGKQDKLKKQSDRFNEYYSWDNRIIEWERLFNQFKV
jgi:glycosyltransferase involved in cell wall biosynthesis